MASKIFSPSFLLLFLVVSHFLLPSTLQAEEGRKGRSKRSRWRNLRPPLTWRAAHGYCRRRGYFLEDNNLRSGAIDSSFQSFPLVWTGLTTLRGRYQWLSRCPDGMKQVSWASGDGSGPNNSQVLLDGDCPAFNVTNQRFSLQPCDQELSYKCTVEYGYEVPSNVELNVTVNGILPAPSGGYDWYKATQQEMEALTLTCTAYTKGTGVPLEVQPEVFWSKDSVYTGHCSREFTPATQAAQGSQEGLYQCAAWSTPFVQPLRSEKVLVTLHDPQEYGSAYLSSVASNSSAEALSSNDVKLVAEIFESFTHVNNTSSSLDLDRLTDVLNTIMGESAEVLQDAQVEVNASAILLETFEELAFKVQLPPGGQDQGVNVSREHISVQRVALDTNTTIIGYQSFRNKSQEDVGILRRGDSLRNTEAAIVFPSGLIYNLSESSQEENQREPRVELTLAVYRNTKLFQDTSIASKYIVDMPIIQAAFKNHVLRNLDTPVKIFFSSNTTFKGSGGKCVFWEFGKNEGRGGWSDDGCWEVDEEVTTDDDNEDYTVCNCNHLTSFAHLINYSEDSGIEGIHADILDIITIIGCSLSMISLALIIFTFIFFREWRQILTNKIHFNLAVAIFLAVVTFTAGIKLVWNAILCRAVAVALHYSMLASFGWMLVEGACLYVRIVRVKMESHLTSFFRVSSACAWVIPVLPVLTLCIYDLSLYDNKTQGMCWMSPWVFKMAFLPALVVTLAINLILFSWSLYAATCGRQLISSSASQRKRFINQVSLSVCGFFLLGFTWFFGLLAVGELRLVFSYLFCIFNILQGVFLFLIVRKHWVKVLSSLITHTSAFFSSRLTRETQVDPVIYDCRSGQVSAGTRDGPQCDARRDRASTPKTS